MAMGRHYTPEQKTQFSGGFIATVIAIFVAIIALIAWLVLGSGSADSNSAADGAGEQSCIEGDLQLPVASGDKTLAQSLLASWNATTPVVRDYCVQAVVAEDISKAAVFIDANSPLLQRTIEAAGRKPASSTAGYPLVAGQAAGIYDPTATTDAEVRADLPADVVSYPGDSPASAVVATALADDATAGADLLLRDENTALADAAGPTAAVQAMSAQGQGSFRALEGAYVEYAAVVLNQTGEIDEEQIRAAHTFVEDLAEQYHGFESDPQAQGQVESEETNQRLDASAVWESYLARTTKDFGSLNATTKNAASATEDNDAAGSGDSDHSNNTDEHATALQATDTMFLLDTSENMGAGFANDVTGPTRFQAAADAIAAVAPALSEAGHAAALWNYSSPLNPGVQQGWRRNIWFSDGAETARSVQLLGTGGVPQTNEALLAAAHAISYYAATQQGAAGIASSAPARIVLITSGTADAYADFAEQFRAALGENAQLAVIHVGAGEPDAALREVATDVQVAKNAAELDQSLRRAVGI